MSAVNYGAILDAIQSVLTGKLTAGIRIEQEPALYAGAEGGSMVAIYLVERLAPDDLQRMQAGTTTHMELVVSILCLTFSLVSPKQAKLDALALAGQVEVALLTDRTLAGTVRRFRMQGGIVDSNQNMDNPDIAFVAMAEVRMSCHVVASSG